MTTSAETSTRFTISDAETELSSDGFQWGARNALPPLERNIPKGNSNAREDPVHDPDVHRRPEGQARRARRHRCGVRPDGGSHRRGHRAHRHRARHLAQQPLHEHRGQDPGCRLICPAFGAGVARECGTGPDRVRPATKRAMTNLRAESGPPTVANRSTPEEEEPCWTRSG